MGGMAFQPFVVGKYQAVELLGEGASGAVYLGRVEGTQGRPDRQVALKILGQDCTRVHDLILAQARKVALLRNRNVVRVGAADKVAGRSCVVMEVVDGLDLGRLLLAQPARLRRLPLPLATYVAWSMLRGLSHALARPGEDGRPLGLTHGGLKASNVLLRRDGQVLLTGFGVARCLALLPHTASGRLRRLGPHAAPEARGRGATDTRADVYGTAALLWECATGAPPASGGDGGSDAFSSVEESLFGAQLHAVLDKALAQDPSQRFPTPADLANALTPAMTGHTPESLGQWLGRLVRQALGEVASEDGDPNHTVMLDGSSAGLQALRKEVTAPAPDVDPQDHAASVPQEVVAGELEADAAAVLMAEGLDQDEPVEPQSGVFEAAGGLPLVPTTLPGEVATHSGRTGVSQLTALEELFPLLDDPVAALALEPVDAEFPPLTSAGAAPGAPAVVPARARRAGTWTGRPFTFADLGFPPTLLGGRDVLRTLAMRTVSRECSVTPVDAPARPGHQLGVLLALDHLSLFVGLGDAPRHTGTTNTNRLGRLTAAYHQQRATGVFSLLGPKPEHYAALFLVDGWLHYACVSEATDSLLDVFPTLATLDDNALNLLVALVTVDGLALGDALAALGVLDPTALAQAMVALTHRRLDRVAQWRQCRFEFRPDVRLPYALPVPEDPVSAFAGEGSGGRGDG